MPQLSYTDAPAAALAGMWADTGLKETLSRLISTQKLVSVQIDATPDNGTFTITINGVEAANFVASTSTQAQVRDGLLADLANNAIVGASAGAAGQLLIEGKSEDADFTLTVLSTGTGGDIVATTLVAFGQTVPFGVGVVADDRGKLGRQVRLPRQATDITGGAFLGIALADTSREYNASGYADGSAIPVGHRGRIAVTPENTVADGAVVFCRYAAGAGGTQLGAFRSDADTASAAQVPNARFRKDDSGAIYVEIAGI